MKKTTFILTILFTLALSSFRTEDLSGRYVYIDVQNEWDLELTLNNGIFTLIDSSGCVRMSQKGKYELLQNQDSLFPMTVVIKCEIVNKYVLNDASGRERIVYVSNLDSLTYSIEKEYYFPLVVQDTLVIYNKDSCMLRGVVFFHFDGDVESERILRQEKKIISKFGEEKYIEILGDGQGKEKARENLKYKKCR